MKRLTLLPLAFASLLVAFPVATTFAADPPPAQPGMDEMMKVMAEGAKVGEQHKQLGKYVGDWTYTIKMWMDPSAPPMDMTGTMHADALLGGRFVQSVWKGDFMGAPFEGHSTEGYDNVTGQFMNTWIDNQSTGIIYTTGTAAEDGKSITYVGEMTDPMSHQKSATKSTITWLSDDSFKNESFYADPSGKMVPSMVIVATRKK